MSFLWVSVLLGCQQDLLLMGDLTRLGGGDTASVPRLARVEAVVEPVPVEVAGVAVPVPVPEPAAVADDAVADRPPAVVPPADGKFNPISVPEGPREGDGVRWEGVKAKGRSSVPPGTRREVDGFR